MTTPADFYLLMERINSLLKELDEKLGQVDRAFQGGMRKLDDLAEWLGDGVESARQGLIKLKRMIDRELTKIRADFARFARGAQMVLTMMEMDDKWFEIRNLANAVAAKLDRPGDRLDRHWEGPAAVKYFTVVTPQVEAARRTAAIADRTGITLQDMAQAGAIFYAALAAALVVVVGGLITAIAGLLSVVGAPVGVAGILVALAAAVTLTAAAYNFMLQQDKAGSNLEGEATNVLGFGPGPSWPKAAAVSSDVTARDGDPADWRPVHP